SGQFDARMPTWPKGWCGAARGVPLGLAAMLYRICTCVRFTNERTPAPRHHTLAIAVEFPSGEEQGRPPEDRGRCAIRRLFPAEFPAKRSPAEKRRLAITPCYGEPCDVGARGFEPPTS